MAKVREPAHPSGMIPGRAPPPARSGGQMRGPVMEPAFQTTPGRSANKAPVRAEPAFKTRGGKGNGS